MNVLIWSENISIIRSLQNVIRNIMEEGEKLEFFLEWRKTGVEKTLGSTVADLIIIYARNIGAQDMDFINAYRKEHSFTEVIYVVDTLTVESLWKFAYAWDCFCVETSEKPENYRQILDKVFKRMKKTKHMHELEQNNHFWVGHVLNIQQQFWSRFLNGKISLDPIDILKEAENCGISLRLSDNFHLVLLSRQLIKKRTQSIEEETRIRLFEAARQWFSKYDTDYFLAEQMRPFLILKNISRAQMLKMLQDFVDYTGTHYSIPLCCYYESDIYCESMFNAARKIINVEQEMVAEAPGVYPASSSDEEVIKKVPVIPDHANELLQNGQYIQFQQIIKSMLWDNFSRGIRRSYLKMLKMDIQQMIYIHLKERGLPAHCVMFSEERNDINRNAHISVDSFILWMENIFRMIPVNDPRITVIESVKHYIREHLQDDLSREKIADQFYLNADYLGKIFKKETGESLGNFIAAEKMKAAAKMLISSDKTVSEISALLDYDNFSHFSRSFKKHLGVSPREYRNQYTAPDCKAKNLTADSDSDAF